VLEGSHDDGDELLSRKRSAADKETVNVRLLGKDLGIAGVDRATVDDAGVLGDCRRDVLLEPFTGPDVSLLGLVRSGSATSSDSPNRLVSDDDASPVLLVLDALLESSHLTGNDLLGLVVDTLLLELADAEDDVETSSKGSSGLLGEELVGLAKDVTTLAVAEEGPLEAKVLGSGSAQLAGEGTSLDVDVLGAHLETLVDGLHDIGDVEGLRSNNKLDLVGRGEGGNSSVQVSNKLLVAGNSAVAFPVSSNEESTHVDLCLLQKKKRK